MPTKPVSKRPIWVSSTEPLSLRNHILELGGKVSTFPEKYGSDIAWIAKGKIWGVQRKEVKDFIASVMDGRLGLEVQQMQQLYQGVIIIEGEWRYTNDGLWMDGWKGSGHKLWSREAIQQIEFGLQSKGLWIRYAKTTQELATLVSTLLMWTEKDSHGKLVTRPGLMAMWGTPQNRDYQIHLLTGLPGVGIELANRILDSLGMILGRTVTVDQLMTVQGMGKVKAEKIAKAIPLILPPPSLNG